MRVVPPAPTQNQAKATADEHGCTPMSTAKSPPLCPGAAPARVHPLCAPLAALLLALSGCATPPPPPPTPPDAHVPPFARASPTNPSPASPSSPSRCASGGCSASRCRRRPARHAPAAGAGGKTRARTGPVAARWRILVARHEAERGGGSLDRQARSPGNEFPPQDGDYAWSAAFVSYVMRIAGAGPRFPYSLAMPITSTSPS